MTTVAPHQHTLNCTVTQQRQGLNTALVKTSFLYNVIDMPTISGRRQPKPFTTCMINRRKLVWLVHCKKNTDVEQLKSHFQNKIRRRYAVDLCLTANGVVGNETSNTSCYPYLEQVLNSCQNEYEEKRTSRARFVRAKMWCIRGTRLSIIPVLSVLESCSTFDVTKPTGRQKQKFARRLFDRGTQKIAAGNSARDLEKPFRRRNASSASLD